MSPRCPALPTLSMVATLLFLAGCGEPKTEAVVSTPVNTPSTSGGTAPPAPAAAKPARMDPDGKYLKAGETRTFDVVYTAKVPKVPAGTKKLRVWVPVPQDSAAQTITGLSFEGPVKESLHTEKRFGNRLAYWEVENPGESFEATMSFKCARREIITDLAALSDGAADTDAAVTEFLKDDRLTFVDENIRSMAGKATEGKKTTLEKARAMYDLVAAHMTYDKSGEGWGRGDTKHACDVGKGNCTDFHAMFMSLARAEKIPAGFEIGLYMPYVKGKSEPLGGYHCWTWFRVPGRTWVPVDISEADRNPDRLDYFFGSQTPNRVTLATGRDLVLEPKQDGEPLNYILNPYAEADGKSVDATKTWTGKDEM